MVVTGRIGQRVVAGHALVDLLAVYQPVMCVGMR